MQILEEIIEKGESRGFDTVAFYAVPDLHNSVYNVEVHSINRVIVKSVVNSNHEDEGMVNLNCQRTIKVVEGDVPKNRINKGHCFPQGNKERREGNSLVCLW